MASTQGSAGEAPFVPFTTGERIKQLGEIDEVRCSLLFRLCTIMKADIATQSIVSMLRTVGSAIQNLGKKGAGTADVAMNTGDGDSEDDESGEDAAFKHQMNDFLRTLRSVNVRMKRQIWGLEEAGIIKSSEGGANDAPEEGGKTLDPDGNGKIGAFDVGWLNSRSNKVERDMESELWDQAESFLQGMLQNGGPTTGGDSHMIQ